MTDTRELLHRISALRQRLDVVPPAPTLTTEDGLDAIHVAEETARRGAVYNQMIEGALKQAQPGKAAVSPAAPVKLTARGAHLIRKGRELLQALRAVADDATFQTFDAFDPLAFLHREGLAMVELLLRTIQAFPPEASAQVRMCDGLEVVWRDAEERTTLLCASLALRRRELAQINELADFLRTLASRKPASVTLLQGLAETIITEAKAGLPLKFRYASPEDPARYAAAHSLNVAHVLARIVQGDAAWAHQLELGVMAALVHDVGMVRVPAELLLRPGPLDSDQRRLLEKHTAIAEEMLTALWPGGGWPIEAASQHHERGDGTGYPGGMKMLEQSPFAQLLAVCDVYAAMCAPRPYRPAHDTRAALTEVLFQSERDYLDKKSAERLLLLSFYPVGSVVELSDGAVAIVIATNQSQHGLANPARPIVHLLADAQAQPTSSPVVIDLLERMDRSIIRSLNVEERRTWLAKKYPQLI